MSLSLFLEELKNLNFLVDFISFFACTLMQEGNLFYLQLEPDNILFLKIYTPKPFCHFITTDFKVFWGGFYETDHDKKVRSEVEG